MVGVREDEDVRPAKNKFYHGEPPGLLRGVRGTASGDAREDAGVIRIVASDEGLLARSDAPNISHSAPNKAPRWGVMNMRTVPPSCVNIHFSSGWRWSFWTPGCIAARSSIRVAEDAEEWALARVRCEEPEVKDGRGEGVSKRVGDERTMGEARGRVERRTGAGRGFGREPGAGVVGCRVGMLGTSSGKRAGRAGSPASLRILRVKTG
ncbi:hypothetical protein DFH09DRAFT_1423668, partial [Mycena vulgaris]